MEKTIITIGHFKDKSEALSFYNSVRDFATCYGVITVAAAKKLCGSDSTWDDNFTGWSLDALHHLLIERVVSDNGWEYTMRFPECDWNNKCNDSKSYTKLQSEPINITISSGEWDTRRNDIEDAFRVLFDNIEKIKDRPVFITIM